MNNRKFFAFIAASICLLLVAGVGAVVAATIAIPYTFTAGTKAQASQVNSNFSTIADDYNGGITNANISATAAIVDTKLATIATAGKVSDSALSANVALENAANAFTSTNSFAGVATFTANPAINISSGTTGSVTVTSTSRHAELVLSAVDSANDKNAAITMHPSGNGSSTAYIDVSPGDWSPGDSEFSVRHNGTKGYILNRSGNTTLGTSDSASTTHRLYVSGLSKFSRSSLSNTLEVEALDGSNDRNAALRLSPSGNGDAVAIIDWGDSDATPATPSDLTISKEGAERLRVLSAGGVEVVNGALVQETAIDGDTTGTIDIDADLGNVFTETLTGNATAIAITNGSVGQIITVVLSNGGATTYTSTLSDSSGVNYAGGSFTGTAANNVCNVVSFMKYGSVWIEVSRALNVSNN